jgi:hypothetical protein
MYKVFTRACAWLLVRRAFARRLAFLLAERTDLLTRVGDLGGVPGFIIICSDIIMSNNIRRNLNAAIAAYANGIAIRRNMPNGHPRKAELNRELKKTLFYIKNLEANLAMRQAATVLMNIQGRVNQRRRAATKIQSAWRAYNSEKRARAPQTLTRALRAESRRLKGNNK